MIFRVVAGLVVVFVGVAGFLMVTVDRPGPSAPVVTPSAGVTSARPSPSPTPLHSDPLVAQACALGPEIIGRIWKGHHPKHSEDITFIPAEPNYWGSFAGTSHSGPWDYLQEVPLVFYGPRYADDLGRVQGSAALVDVYPSVELLLEADFEDRGAGKPLEGVSVSPVVAPKLIVTVMWDGVGRNVLNLHPDSWPVLRRLEREGISFIDAEVGSSPSITPATHANLGTGAYPKQHEVTAIVFRDDAGDVRGVLEGRKPQDLRLSTFADQWDLARANAAKVGLIAWRDWHMPMMGHGSATPGGDKDELALIAPDGRVTGKPDYYSTPDYLKGQEATLAAYTDELDRADGAADGLWNDVEIPGEHEQYPSLVRYQADLTLQMLEQGGYGDDEITDMFFANFKQTDLAGHQQGADSREMREDLEAQDDALGRMVKWLDSEVGEYLLILSADHGHTPLSTTTGAWPISPTEVALDINTRFKVPAGKTLIDRNTAVGPFLDTEVMAEVGVTPEEIASFIAGHTIRDNWPDGELLPADYRTRADEPVFSAVIPAGSLRAARYCTLRLP